MKVKVVQGPNLMSTELELANSHKNHLWLKHGRDYVAVISQSDGVVSVQIWDCTFEYPDIDKVELPNWFGERRS